MSKITKTVFTVEFYDNGESMDFHRGYKVKAAPGHHYCAEFETLEEAREDVRRLAEEFFMRDGGEYDRIVDEQGEAAANKALEEFVAAGRIDDDSNYCGIRAFEVFAIEAEGVAYILADNEDPDFTDAVAAIERFDIDCEITDESEITDDDDPRAAAAEKNEESLGSQIANARRFIEVC